MRSAALTAALLVFWLLPASTAWADPAGPTDYRSAIVSVEPPAPGVHATIIGGDAFLQVQVEPGTAVDVVGYRGEPYLRFAPDGTVTVNDNAPSRYLSEDRYGETTVPGSATPDAPPSWRTVAEDGIYAWHDHRTHWMNESRPAARPGDQILEAVVPITVDGVDTSITVVSTWEKPPSALPALLGVVAGTVVGVAAVRSNSRGVRVSLAAMAGLAVGVATVAYLSVPSETAPSIVPPLAAVTALAVAGFGLLRPATDHLTAAVAPALILTIWGLLRIDWLTRAILPTALPTADRFGTGMVLAGAVVIGLVTIRRMFGPRRPV